jgi:hypothetical protein
MIDLTQKYKFHFRYEPHEVTHYLMWQFGKTVAMLRLLTGYCNRFCCRIGDIATPVDCN